MLQQILETMYVDPELLELMNEDQRQLLFRKMRDEQLRRWKEREKELEKKKKTATKRTPRKVRGGLKRARGGKIQFLLGSDGQPWTWVMGEHRDDLSYDELIRQRERQEREREEEEEREIRRQAEEFAKNETGHILSLASQFGEVRPHSPAPSPKKRMSLQPSEPASKHPAIRRYASAGFGRASLTASLLAVPESGSSSPSMPRTESQLDLSSSTEHVDSDIDLSTSQTLKKESLRRATLTKSVSKIGKTSEEQKQFQARRAEEIYVNMKEVKQLARERSIRVNQSVEKRWKESEEKVKVFERTRKASFNKARQLSKKLPNIDERQLLDGIPEERKKALEQKLVLDRNKDTQKAVRPVRSAPSRPAVRRSSVVLPGTRPKTQDHVVTWFRESEAPQGRCREPDGSISLWFHGQLGRGPAEAVLENKPVGSYLVRLSVKSWGYTISVKTYTEVKHFLVDVSSGQYQFLGPKQTQFRSLQDLMLYYRVNPITTAGQEVLLVPVPQLEPEDSTNFRGLFRDEDTEDTKSTYL